MQQTKNKYLILDSLRKIVLLWLLFTIFSALIKQIPEKAPDAQTYTVLISKWEERFKPIKEDLPFEQGVVSYLNDANMTNVDDEGNMAAEYVLTQFVMAPTIVQQGDKHEWVLLNMTEKNFKIWLEKKGEAYTVSSYSSNLYLAQRIK